VSVLSRLEHIVDLVVIDLELPNETGLGSILESFTTHGFRKASKIVAQTSSHDRLFLGQLYRLGVDPILPKPTSTEQLVGKVHAVLHSSGGNIPRFIQ